MSDTPFIKFFPGDFLGGTSGLTPAERGVYITLLCLIWEGEGPLTMDDGRLARRCGMPKAAFKKALDALIDEGKIIRSAKGLTNERAEKTLMDRQNRIENATHAASRRWSAQEQKTQQNQHADYAEALPEQCAADAKPEARSQIYGGGGSAGAREAENPPPEDSTFRERILAAMGVDPCRLTGRGDQTLGQNADMAHAMRWLDLPGLTEDLVVAEIESLMQRKRDGPPASFRYFDKAMARLSGALTAPPLEPKQPTRTGGTQNDRARFDIAHREYTRRLAAGEIERGPDPSDPFAGR